MKPTRIIILSVLFLLQICCAARAIESAVPGDKSLRIEYGDCGGMQIDFEPLAGDAFVALNLLELQVDGATPQLCSPMQVHGDGSVHTLFESVSGREISMNATLQPGGAPGTAMIELAALDGATVSWQFEFNAELDEHFYGFGEKFNTFDMRGHATRMLNLDKHMGGPDDPAYFLDRSYKTVPFFMSSRGYGVWLDDTSVAYFNMDDAGDGRWRLKFESGRARIYFFAGPRLPLVVERYTALSGRPPLWPAWAFGPWKSRDVHPNRQAVEEDILRQRELDIPGSVIVIDSPWETCYNNYTFNEMQFPKYREMIAMAHDNGYRVVLWITPLINIWNFTDMVGIQPDRCQNYSVVNKNDGFVKDKDGRSAVVQWWKGTGSIIDFTNPGAAKYWVKSMKSLLELGADGFKVDDGESQFCIDGLYSDGTPGARMMNYYSVLYHKYTYQAIEELRNGDGVVFARAGASGAQKYGIPWAGDNFADFSESFGLPSVVVAGQSMAMSGFPVWAHDIGGYITRKHKLGEGDYKGGGQTAELFMRWTQFGALSPVMQMHTTSNKGAWDFGGAALENYRKYAKLHTSLFPYLYALNAEAARTGMPMMRPLPLLYQEYPEAHVQRYEYLLGPDLLVGVVVEEGATTKEIYFPPGEVWVDIYHDFGKEYAGGQLAVVPAPLDAMPVFARRGAIIPMLPADTDTLVPASEVKVDGIVAPGDRLEVHVIPGGEPAAFETVDGVLLEATPTDAGLQLCAAGPPRDVTFKVLYKEPSKVQRSGVPIPKTGTPEAADSHDWFDFDSAMKILSIHIQTSGGSACVVVE